MFQKELLKKHLELLLKHISLGSAVEIKKIPSVLTITKYSSCGIFLSFFKLEFLSIFSFCLPVFQFFILQCICLSVFLTFCLSVFLSFCLSVFLSFCLSVFLSFWVYDFLSLCFSVFFLSIFLSFCISVCFPVCLCERVISMSVSGF
jgi:hypothetical protein